MSNDVEDSVLLTEVSQLAEENLYRSIQEREIEYQRVFEELSTIRSELRVVRQENQWFKTVKCGLEQEVSALKDILKQKKQIIANMGDDINQKNMQLTQLQTQINGQLQNEETLLLKLEQYEQEIQQLRAQTDRFTETITKESKQVDIGTSFQYSPNHSPSRLKQDQVSTKLNERVSHSINLISDLFKKIKPYSYETQDQGKTKSPKSQPSKQGNIDSSIHFTHKIEQLIRFSQQLVITSEKLNRQLQSNIRKEHQTQPRLSELQKRSYQLELEKHQLTLDLQKSRHTQKFITDKFHVLEQQYSKFTQQYEQRLEQQRKHYNSFQTKYEQCKQERQTYKKRTFEHILPHLKPFIPAQLPELISQLQELKEQQPNYSVISREIERLATLHTCKQKHNDKLESNQQHIRRQLVELEGENDILRIKLANLERAYENAVDDYRRSIRFATARKKHGDNYSTTSNKQNQQGNIANHFYS